MSFPGTKSTSRTKQTHSRPFVFKMKSDEFVEELSINSEKALSVNSEVTCLTENPNTMLLETPIPKGVPHAFQSTRELPSIPTNKCKEFPNTPKFPATKKITAFKLDNRRTSEATCDENNTLYISASNISITEENPQKVRDPQTPHSPKQMSVKKKQVNVVVPTPIKKNQNILKFGTAMQISSTPNNSLIPVKSIPTAEEIFWRSRDKPSTSNSDFEYSEIPANNHYTVRQEVKNITGSPENNDTSIKGKLWKFVNNVTNALHNLSAREPDQKCVENFPSKSFKRHLVDEVFEEPVAKRYKLTEIKCRRTIRNLPPLSFHRKSKHVHINIVNNIMNNVVNNVVKVNIPGEKTYADKATQTDAWVSI